MKFSPNPYSSENSWHFSSVVSLTHFLYIFHLTREVNEIYTEDSFWVKFKCCLFCCCCKKYFKMGMFWSLWKDQRRGLTFELWIRLHFLKSNCRIIDKVVATASCCQSSTWTEQLNHPPRAHNGKAAVVFRLSQWGNAFFLVDLTCRLLLLFPYNSVHTTKLSLFQVASFKVNQSW